MNMIILGIETSCDDTGIAILEVSPTRKAVGARFNILSNVVSSQIKTHAPFGGVVPNLAAREHLKNIGPCLKTALKEANKTIQNIDLIAVTVGPGLIPSLLIGVNFAKALAYKYNIPIVSVNHLEGHITAAFNGNFSCVAGSRPAGPAVALLVSGGHTQLILMKGVGQYKIIGETRDDAAGECFDKVAKLLRLPYPGGPEIAKQAAKVQPTADHPQGGKIHLPRPMMNQNNFDFSFSGLKTAVLYLVNELEIQSSKKKQSRTSNLEPNTISALCAEVQQAIIDVLIDKTFKAVEKYKAKTIILSGGVAANEELRKQFEVRSSKFDVKFFTPVKNLCMDNGAMIAMAGYLAVKRDLDRGRGDSLNRIIANANLRIK